MAIITNNAADINRKKQQAGRPDAARLLSSDIAAA
jgi:hypothetical protein